MGNASILLAVMAGILPAIAAAGSRRASRLEGGVTTAGGLTCEALTLPNG